MNKKEPSGSFFLKKFAYIRKMLYLCTLFGEKYY